MWEIRVVSTWTLRNHQFAMALGDAKSEGACFHTPRQAVACLRQEESGPSLRLPDEVLDEPITVELIKLIVDNPSYNARIAKIVE